jgi:hypothetical protein
MFPNMHVNIYCVYSASLTMDSWVFTGKSKYICTIACIFALLSTYKEQLAKYVHRDVNHANNIMTRCTETLKF